jgi:hypothetical protein
MTHLESTSPPARNPADSLVWPQVRSGPLVVGGILTGIGAAAAGAATWRGHPNAQVRLVRRASSAG